MPTSKRGGRPGYTVATPRKQRADAVANRARILAAATDAFDRDGLSVSLDDIALRAGLGAGTLHRHFPTKAALIDATIAERVRSLVESVEQCARSGEPATALLDALTAVVDQGVASHALADRLRSEAGDIDAAVAGPVADLRAHLAGLLRRAQAAGGIRRDIDAGDLDALLAAAHTLVTHPAGRRELVPLLWTSITTDG